MGPMLSSFERPLIITYLNVVQGSSLTPGPQGPAWRLCTAGRRGACHPGGRWWWPEAPGMWSYMDPCLHWVWFDGGIDLALDDNSDLHSHPTLCNPMDCSLPGSSVHGILQARIQEWVAISFTRGSSLPGDWTWVSCLAGGFFTVWATREVPVHQGSPWELQFKETRFSVLYHSSRVLSQLEPQLNTGAGLRYWDGKYYQREKFKFRRTNWSLHGC